MADTAEPTFEEFLGLLLEARDRRRLTDEHVREIAIVLKEEMPSIPPPGEVMADVARVHLVVLVSRAEKRGRLTPDAMRDILARLDEARPSYVPPVLMTSPPPAEVRERRDSMGPELIVGEASAEDIPEDEERGPDTDPPPDEDG